MGTRLRTFAGGQEISATATILHFSMPGGLHFRPNSSLVVEWSLFLCPVMAFNLQPSSTHEWKVLPFDDGDLLLVDDVRSVYVCVYIYICINIIVDEN